MERISRQRNCLGYRKKREVENVAKKIKFPLKMKNGALVRTLEELRENYDVESLIEHYESGKLLTWLEDHYYDVEVQNVSALNRSAKNFTVLLCNSLGIEAQEEELSDVDTDFLKRRVEKLEYLKTLTADEMILNKVDEIAISQEDLIDLLDMGKHTIYLCQGEFTVPLSVPNMTYIGIFNPCAVVRATDNVNFKEKNIVFEEMPFLWDASGVTAQDRSYQAERLFMEGKYEKAKEICEELVKEDNPRALMLLYRISMSYIYDSKKMTDCRERGVTLNCAYNMIDNEDWKFSQNHKLLLKRIADTGTSFDQFYYGFALYKYGCQTGYNYDDDMMLYYDKAAKQENPSAISGLGNRYYNGDGIEKNISEAIKWYKKAAKLGHIDSMETLANCYDSGTGVGQDYEMSLVWRKRAAKLGSVESIDNLGWHYRNGKGVERDYTEAMKWYLKAAEKGSSYSQENIGDLYYYGYGVNQDYEKAAEWYQKAADNGNVEAMELLAKCYDAGNGVEQDYNKSLELRKKAAERGYGVAIGNIGWHYRWGNGVIQDYQIAMKWFMRGAERNNAYSQMNIGDLYYNGDGVAQDYQKAKEWYQKAAANGDSDAKDMLSKF